ncbi:ketose-bisphosphate aldolase [Collinsella sp. AGMB00827]|uniref:Ketose-bisphosphate aldolase n=1 Tax=Collinsella ureilytica TaxID=2869515 RepID=A0ABS7MJY1_9ACTN|nr:ketose-bisphosphate aldolase [Collinsella urealyticum]MBY4797674.1 ketose-bisphosphate aldolase [Collinsella urealyticum]
MLRNMADLLQVAHERNFAIPAFNVSQDSMLKAVIECCEEESAPVILAIHPNELEWVGDSFVEMAKDLAHQASVPVAIHLDHGGSLEQVYRAVRDGFTSVMIDASSKSFDENVAITKEVVAIAHPLGISVEAELGTIGTADNNPEGNCDEIIFTKVEDAIAFVQETKVDCLAVAIGTAHGLYPSDFQPHLEQELLSEIKAAVDIPLVLHGGSGNPDSEIAEAVKRGINKINISSDIKASFMQQARIVLENPQVREPLDIFPSCVEALKKTAAHKIHLFGANDKAHFYTC